jgi:hypothetical protein
MHSETEIHTRTCAVSAALYGKFCQAYSRAGHPIVVSKHMDLRVVNIKAYQELDIKPTRQES